MDSTPFFWWWADHLAIAPIIGVEDGERVGARAEMKNLWKHILQNPRMGRPMMFVRIFFLLVAVANDRVLCENSLPPPPLGGVFRRFPFVVGGWFHYRN